MEYISKQLAVEELENLRQFYEMNDDCDELVARKCKNAVAALPVADVVPVVRCQECKHYKEHRTKKYGNLICRCTRIGKYDMDYPVMPDDFCSYGERPSDAPLQDYDFEFC